MKTDAKHKNKEAQNTTHESLWGRFVHALPHRVTFIIGNFKDDQPRQLAEAIDKIRKRNNVIIIESSEEVKIRKVFI